MSAEILADLSRAKVLFQMRTLRMVMGLPASCDSGSHAERQDREDGLGPKDGRAAPEEGHRPNTVAPPLHRRTR